ncbi:MAG TPA: DNA polymerase III subunit beta, partial [Thermomicrobiaceae bacterium]|nr:DNA polymerase III subunit beta [Thermomicrobiaceae bacterium]
ASLPSEQVTLQLERASMTLGVQAGRSKAHVKGIAAEDFPAIATISETPPSTRIDPVTFREMIAQVAFAAATDDSRPVLAGVLAEFSGSSLSLAAADGFRLSLRRAELSAPVTDEMAIIIPARALQELSRIIGDQTDPIELAVTPQQSQLLIRSGSIEFMTRLIDGHFPDVKRIIPDQYQTRVILNRDAFLAAARRARLFAESNNDVVKIEMTPGDGDLDPGFATVSAQAAETGDNEDYLEARVEGEQMQIAFNSRYLTDVLAVLRGTEVALEMKGTNAAGVFKLAGDADFTHVIMPIVMG